MANSIVSSIAERLAGAAPDQVAHLLADYGVVGPAELLLTITEIKRQRPDLASTVDREFQSIAYFYDDAPGELGELAREAIRRSECTSVQDAIIASHDGDLAGLQLVNEQGQGALFLPDASEPGRVRASFFDQRGFYGHSTKDTYVELLSEIFRDGYTREAPGTFEQYSSSSAFAEGNSLVAKLQAVNSGLVSLADALRSQRLTTAPANSMKL